LEGGNIGDDMHLVNELLARPRNGYTKAQFADARERILNKKLAYGILVRADRGRYGKLIEEIKNAFL
jgi:predicted metal-dependent phosphoesterase TrpH